MMRNERLRRWLRLRRDPIEDIDDELRFHLEERVRDYVARGMDPDSARRAALTRMGDVDRARIDGAALLSADLRARDRRVRLNVSLLDVKLGLRMFAKYPGLSLVSVLGMALAIAIGAGVFGAIGALLDPTLPLEEGDRIVAVQNNRADSPGSPDPQVLDDFVTWQSELTTVRDLGAFRRTSRNLIIEGRGTDLVRIAEMSAAGFRVARIPPLLGRPLLEDDERAGAPPVLVLGHDEWRRQFDADPDIIGRTVRLDEIVHTVVGVMPEGFRFPVNHGFWAPLRLEAARYELGGGPSINVFGRLADGVTFEQARAQVAAIGRRMAAAYPDTHEHHRPTIVPYAYAALPDYDIDVDDPMVARVMYAIRLAVGLLLVLVAANVAVLVYARTATRAGEIAVRTALGASRARVVAQLFVEALIVSLAAAALGLTVAVAGLDWLERLMAVEYSLPFWFDLRVSGGLIAYVAGLAVLGGTIAGVLPALKATGRNVNGGLQQLGARGSQMRLGPTWTALIIVQVGVAVAVLPLAIYVTSELVRAAMSGSDYPAEEFFSAEPMLERAEALPGEDADAHARAWEARFAERAGALMRRFAAEPGVGASFASELPGLGNRTWFEIEGGVAVVDPSATAASEATVRAAVTSVGTGYFDLFDAAIIAGRGFVDADAARGSTAVIVDRTFAERLGRGNRSAAQVAEGAAAARWGGNVVGRWIRPQRVSSQADDAGPETWLQIIGVVSDLPSRTGSFGSHPQVYSTATPGAARALIGGRPANFLILRARGGPTPDFTRRLRDIVASIDPGFQLHELQNWGDSDRNARRTYRTFAVGVTLAMLSVLLLSAAGIHAMLAFTVARRRREIGIRIALGADRRRILGGIFARAGAQLGTGVAVGLLLAFALQWATDADAMGNRSGVGAGLLDAFRLIPIVAAIVLVVGLFAALGPARRGLAVQPTEALREE